MKTTTLIITLGLVLTVCAITEVIHPYFSLPCILLLTYGISRYLYFDLDTVEFDSLDAVTTARLDTKVIFRVKINDQECYVRCPILKKLFPSFKYSDDLERYKKVAGKTIRMRDATQFIVS